MTRSLTTGLDSHAAASSTGVRLLDSLWFKHATNDMPRSERIILSLPDEQRRIIETLPMRAEACMASGDYLEAYLLHWIAFNVLCESAYGESAWRLVAKVRPNDGALDDIADKAPVHGRVLRDASRTELIIDDPTSISIALEERYIEALVFSQFGAHFAEVLPHLDDREHYDAMAESLGRAFEDSHASLINHWKSQEHSDATSAGISLLPTVINYGRLRRYKKIGHDMRFSSLRRAGVLFVMDPKRPQDIVRAIYQVRCNLMHGSRDAGGVNSYTQVLPASFRLLVFLYKTALSTMMEISINK